MHSQNQNKNNDILSAALDDLDDDDSSVSSSSSSSIPNTKFPNHDESKSDLLHSNNHCSDSLVDTSSIPAENDCEGDEDEKAIAEMMKQMEILFQNSMEGASSSSSSPIHTKNTNSSTKSPQTLPLSKVKSSTNTNTVTPKDTKKKSNIVNSSSKSKNNTPTNTNSLDSTISQLIADLSNDVINPSSADPNKFSMNHNNEELNEEEMMKQLAKEFENVMKESMMSQRTNSSHNGNSSSREKGNDSSQPPPLQEDMMNDIVDNMMKQLLSKEFMYEPMKDICDKYPKWLYEHKASLSNEEYQRYGHQYQYFQRIVALYESNSEQNTQNENETLHEIAELMHQVQEYGQPPKELIQELAPDLELNENGIPQNFDFMNAFQAFGSSGGDDLGGSGGMDNFPPFNNDEDCSIM